MFLSLHFFSSSSSPSPLSSYLTILPALFFFFSFHRVLMFPGGSMVAWHFPGVLIGSVLLFLAPDSSGVGVGGECFLFFPISLVF